MQQVEHQSVVTDPSSDGCGGVHVYASPHDGEKPSVIPTQTLLGTLARSCAAHSSSSAIVYRPQRMETTTTVIDSKGKPKEWKYIHLDATQYISYADFWGHIQCFGASLEAHALVGQDCRVGIFADTRWEWICSLYGMWTRSVVGVTVYSTLDDDALAHAITEAELSAICVSADKIERVLTIAAPTLRYVICFDPLPQDIVIPGGVCLVSFHDMLWRDAPDVAAASAPPAREVTQCPTLDDLSMIMYTSGTTGFPRGVMMTHHNLAMAVQSTRERIAAALAPKPRKGECYVAFLPLAHILELTAENLMF